MNKDQIFGYIGDLNGDIINLKIRPGDTTVLNAIKETLNKLFPDAVCSDVTYTLNTDKQFFGIIVMPVLSAQQVTEIMTSDDEYRIKSYKVELDSKLYSPIHELDTDEIVSLLIHEVGVLVTNESPIRNARYLINSYLTYSNTTIRLSDYISYIELLGFGIKEAARRSVSIFHNEYMIPFQLDEAYDLTSFLKSAITKLEGQSNTYGTIVDSKSIIIKWVLRLYKNILKYRIQAIHTLQKGIDISGSRYEQLEMDKIIRRLKRIDDHSLITEASASIMRFFDKNKKASSNALERFRSNGVKAYFDDYYTIQFEVNNMDDDRALAIMLLHKINSRMSVIDDYITTEDGLSAQTVKQLQDLYQKYDKLRYTISSQKLKSPRTLLINYGDD